MNEKGENSMLNLGEESEFRPFFENGDNLWIYAEYATHLHMAAQLLNDRLVQGNMEPNAEQSRFIAESIVLVKLVEFMDEGDIEEQQILAQHPLCKRALAFNTPERAEMIGQIADIIRSDGIVMPAVR